MKRDLGWSSKWIVLMFVVLLSRVPCAFATEEEPAYQLWQIGDVETVNPDTKEATNWADEFNAQFCSEEGVPRGCFPPINDPFVFDLDSSETDISSFPWNSKFANPVSYAKDIRIRWTGGLPCSGRVRLSWSPGVDDPNATVEIKNIYLDGTLLATISAYPPSWDQNQPYFDGLQIIESVVDITEPIAHGRHELRFKQIAGDGTVWDWIRLEAVECRTLWHIGDVDVNAEQSVSNYSDEFNVPVGTEENECDYDPLTEFPLGCFPDFDDQEPFEVGVHTARDFPWNSKFGDPRPYAKNFEVQWDGGLPCGGRLTLSWSPGLNVTGAVDESKDVYLDSERVLSINGINPQDAQSGQPQFLGYPLFEHSVNLVGTLDDGVHTFLFDQTEGDGTLWDWLRLDANICSPEP